MTTDNVFWMTHVGVNWAPVLQLWNETRVDIHRQPRGIAGFNIGDVVRIHKEGRGVHGRMCVIESLGSGATEGKLCLKPQGTDCLGCYKPESLVPVALDEWRPEEGTGIPIEIQKQNSRTGESSE